MYTSKLNLDHTQVCFYYSITKLQHITIDLIIGASLCVATFQKIKFVFHLAQCFITHTRWTGNRRFEHVSLATDPGKTSVIRAGD